MTWEDDKKLIRHAMLGIRERENASNPLRTNYYGRYWTKNPEIPWALLAHLVSRNAGYQMSDLRRYIEFDVRPGVHPFDLLTDSHIKALFALLETGNFLIFRDVYPLLEAYQSAKWYMQRDNVDRSTELFQLLSDGAFDADPFIVEEWLRFFDEAKAANWDTGWSLEWSADSPIARLTRALIINEQNQIHDRLLSDPSIRVQYLGLFSPTVDLILTIADALLDATKLCFPVATSSSDATPQHLLIYEVEDFDVLESRIQTGLDLFYWLLQSEPTRTFLTTWVLENPGHHGTRTDYNAVGYSMDRGAAATWSPPLVPHNNYPAVWYDVGTPYTPAYRNVYAPPIGLSSNTTPYQVKTRPGFDYERFLAPHNPVKTVAPHALSERAEIVF